MHPTTIAAIRAAMAEAGFAGAYDALAESHAELIKALEMVLSDGYDIPADGEDTDDDWGIVAETREVAQAVLDTARKL